MTRQRRARTLAGVGLTTTGWWRRPLLTTAAIALTLILGAAGATFTRTNYELVGYAPEFAIWFAVWQAMPVLISLFRPFVGWSAFIASVFVVPFAIEPIDRSEPWPLIPTALIAYLVVQYAVARRHGLLVTVSTWLLGVMSVMLASSAGGGAHRQEASQDVTLFTLLSAFALVVGTSVRLWERAQVRLAEEERLTEGERSRRLLLEERARIAREMHDIVAHHMSMIAVQSSTAEYRLDGLTPSAREEFASIGRAARESMTEMRRLLRVLRDEDDDRPRTPQPGVDDLAQLVDATIRAGTPVNLAVGSLPPGLPELVGLTAYRIVQEALSNVVRHSPGATTRVGMTCDDGGLVVAVENDQPPDPVAPVEAPRSGHGLAGMRERVQILGGDLETGPRAGGGFAVKATLPLRPAADRSVLADGEVVGSRVSGNAGGTRAVNEETSFQRATSGGRSIGERRRP
ncbi:sensor histidine kinase [Actinopolymorpha sp. B11F2]|uniref:sensor histidine kinase n=1 Tax=Actinopolymorpha sp. B11F2 TaxID=3160862 RepID=UPI0032E4E5B4